MRKRWVAAQLAWITVLVAGSKPAMAQKLCDEFISKPACEVDLNMSSAAGEVTPQYKVSVPVQSDVMINSGGAGIVVLQHASPFLACSIAATPGTPARDLSSAVTAALTTIGGFVIPTAPPAPPHLQDLRDMLKTRPEGPAPGSGEERLTTIENERIALSDLETRAFKQLTDLYASLKQTLRTNWRYSFGSEAAVQNAVMNLNRDLQQLLAVPGTLGAPVPGVTSLDFPDIARIQSLSKKMQDDLTQFYKDFAADIARPGSTLPAMAQKVGTNVTIAAANADLVQSSFSDLRKKAKQYADFLIDVSVKADIHLPMAPYKQKAVTETITCKDVVSGNQPFDSMIFTAYYENTPMFDISAGAIISLLPGRQVGTISGPLAPGPAAPATSVPASGACGAFNPSETCLGVTSTARPQFMPAAFFELHPWNGKCPWAKNGEARHPFGYVCSFGLAGGISVNPNNGTATAEFFEGVSFGIQRVAFLCGIHNGRYQTFSDGYYVGEAVPSGTMARTERNWTNHFAVGIAYRIPLR
jgi:hypothetical protein